MTQPVHKGQFHALVNRPVERGAPQVQGSMRAVPVVEVLVFAQDGHQVALVPYQGPVQQLTPAAADRASMTEFIRGAWTAERITLMPAAWNTESNVAVKLAFRSCSTNFARVPRLPGP